MNWKCNVDRQYSHPNAVKCIPILPFLPFFYLFLTLVLSAFYHFSLCVSKRNGVRAKLSMPHSRYFFCLWYFIYVHFVQCISISVDMRKHITADCISYVLEWDLFAWYIEWTGSFSFSLSLRFCISFLPNHNINLYISFANSNGILQQHAKSIPFIIFCVYSIHSIRFDFGMHSKLGRNV